VPPAPGCPGTGPSSPEVTRVICRVPSTPFSQAPGYALPVHLCRFGVRSVMAGLFPGRPPRHAQSVKGVPTSAFVTSARPWNINQVPIDYAFRPRLRGRLTLRGLTVRRNPWTSGESVSHTLCRYSCQHSHFRYLQVISRLPFAGLRNAPLPRALRHTRSFGGWLEPRYIFGAGRLRSRPVSYYAFFKGWLLLSQPPGCHGLPTSFPT
jgi:hypothetical protein